MSCVRACASAPSMYDDDAFSFCDLFTSFPIVAHQFARTKGHGYGRGSGPPRPRYGSGGGGASGGGRGLVTLRLTRCCSLSLLSVLSHLYTTCVVSCGVLCPHSRCVPDKLFLSVLLCPLTTAHSLSDCVSDGYNSCVSRMF